MNVYLIENCGNCPGRIQAVFRNKKDAETFCDDMEHIDAHQVVPRTLYEGQPDTLGYNT